MLGVIKGKENKNKMTQNEKILPLLHPILSSFHFQLNLMKIVVHTYHKDEKHM